jgi:hypothetical protein
MHSTQLRYGCGPQVGLSNGKSNAGPLSVAGG